jgi:hypothetical protein
MTKTEIYNSLSIISRLVNGTNNALPIARFSFLKMIISLMKINFLFPGTEVPHPGTEVPHPGTEVPHPGTEVPFPGTGDTIIFAYKKIFKKNYLKH